MEEQPQQPEEETKPSAEQAPQEEPKSHKKLIITIVIALLIIIGGAVAWYFFYAQGKITALYETEPKLQVPVPSAEDVDKMVIDDITDTSEWITYRSEVNGFEISYPAEWEAKTHEGNQRGYILSLLDPENPGNPGYANELTIQRNDEITDYVTGNFETFDEFIVVGEHTHQIISPTTIDGKKAVELIFGGNGAAYGIFIESNGIYALVFEKAWDKTKLSATAQKVLSTLKFIQTKDLQTYNNDELKISFNYPNEWGQLVQKDEPDHIALQVNNRIFLGTDNGEDSLGRGGYWGDPANLIVNQEYINNFCNDKSDCEIKTNQQGITFARNIEKEYSTFGSDPVEAVFYYLFNPKSEYRGVIISGVNLDNDNILVGENIQFDESDMELLIDGLNFID